MKVTHLSHSDTVGGAARAAYRIHQALRLNGIDSTMLASKATSGDWTVSGRQNKGAKVFSKFRCSLAGFLTNTLQTGNPIIHSPAIVPSRWSGRLNALEVDVVHLHWINDEMMSIVDIGNIKKPIVWTLHDMWAFCGAEHCTADRRWSEGYTALNRPSHESGFDLNRWTWKRKLKHWKHPMQIATPSHWLADCARKSVLMRDWPITVIPNAIDTTVWQPVDKAIARQLLGLPPNVPLLLFGAWGGNYEPHKGYDLLQTALNHLREQSTCFELVVFGQLPPKEPEDLGFPIHYVGHLHDDLSLRLLYSASDTMVIPSRIDNLPNTGVEAHACGIPVVAFDTCGLPDIVVHQETGYLAKAFDPADFASGLQWVLDDKDRYLLLSKAARNRAVKLWSNDVVAKQYCDIYKGL